VGIATEKPAWILPAIKKIINTPLQPLSLPPILFSLTKEAAVHNMNILKCQGNSIPNLIEVCPNLFCLQDLSYVRFTFWNHSSCITIIGSKYKTDSLKVPAITPNFWKWTCFEEYRIYIAWEPQVHYQVWARIWENSTGWSEARMDDTITNRLYPWFKTWRACSSRNRWY